MLGIGDMVDITSTTLEQATTAGEQFVDTLLEQRDLFLLSLEFTTYMARSHDVPPTLLARWRANRQQVAELIARFWDEGELGPLPIPAEHAAVIMMGLSDGIAVEKLCDPDGVPDDVFATSFSLIIEALRARAAAQSETKS
jgi:hypothetical protein